MVKLVRFALCSIVAILCAAASLTAEQQGRTILTVTGETEDAQELAFNRQKLKEIGWETITTKTPFLEGEHTFSGTPLADLLTYLDIHSGTLKAFALNDYSVDIPVSDAKEYSVLLALDHNGEHMRVRDRGPIWIIYPMTGSEPLSVDAERRMVWQLKRLDVSR
ncbi:molybdopterin-dependent oxidoreductase [Shimia sp. MMG029]|uniref:molybdopterin-dependent oxidoreductase n=1 Tax=Shimia sp. MMG029 TaxID=3021978 RepID=UPI0022FE324B|nr:molybdopterin-dependent oxidoreductase [Shimia sp. MMG029]MDA5558868.1 molybdopterin-dependent oxidoreductase [Shimia sp. MMG029]